MCEVCEFIKRLDDRENLNKAVGIIQDVIFADDPHWSFSEHYYRRVVRLILQFGFVMVFESAQAMLYQYEDVDKRLEKLPGTVFNKSYRAGDVNYGKS